MSLPTPQRRFRRGSRARSGRRPTGRAAFGTPATALLVGCLSLLLSLSIGAATQTANAADPDGRGAGANIGGSLGSHQNNSTSQQQRAHDAVPVVPTDDLRVRLRTITPGVVPTSGPLLLAGTVTNTTDETWQDVNLHAVASRTPILSGAALSEAAALPQDADVAERWTSPNSFVSAGDLTPGQTKQFRLRIPRDQLIIPANTPGVYWIGVHALGTDSAGRDNEADGRARTFIPEVTDPNQGAAKQVALVVPMRAAVKRNLDGELLDPASWADLVDPEGRLGRIADFANQREPMTLLMDPAILDAADTIARGPLDPALTPAAPNTAETEAGQATGPADNSDAGSDTTAPARGAGSGSTPRRSRAAIIANTWLETVQSATTRHQTLGLGYADPDIAALADRAPSLLSSSFRVGEQTFETYRIQQSPTVAPPNGRLPESVLSQLSSDAVVLLGSNSEVGDSRVASTDRGQPALITDTGVQAGGPEPGSRTSALAMRQQILARAAIDSVNGDTNSPLVVQFPNDWEPGRNWRDADFFAELDRPWLRLVEPELNAPGSPGSAGDSTGPLNYPDSAADQQVPTPMISTALDTLKEGNTYADTLVEPRGAVDGFTKLALQATSYHVTGADSGTAAAAANRLLASIRVRLDGIRVVGSDFVRMSGGSGRIVVTVVNDLDQRVRVRLRATSPNRQVKLETPDVVDLPAGRRATVRIQATTEAIGVATVTLSPVNEANTPVGTPLEFTVRSSDVDKFIWAIMAGAGLLLLIAIVRRWLRRGFNRRRAPATPAEPGSGR